MIKVFPLQDTYELDYFCKVCKDKGYQNNSSYKAMKYDWCKEVGEYWGAYYNDQLVAVAGCHPLPEVSSNAVRVLFRGCQIIDPYKGLNKHHMSSIGFRNILPEQIKFNKGKDLYITTNVYHDASGKMNRTHKAMRLLDKEGILSYTKDIELYFTMQSIWKVNIDEYIKVRSQYV